MSYSRKCLSSICKLWYNDRAGPARRAATGISPADGTSIGIAQGGRGMENYTFTHNFTMGGLHVSPVHVRIEQHPPVIAAHRHANTSYEIHYAQRGRGSVTVGGVTHTVQPGTLYITGRGVEHAQRSDPADPVIEYCLYLNCRRTAQSGDDALSLFLETPFWMGEDRGRVFPLLQQLIDEYRNPQPDTSELLEALLRQIIVRLARLYREGDAAAPAARSAAGMTRAGTVFILEEAFLFHYRTLTLPDLASLMNLSMRQTQRLLQANFGMTFSQKLADARMAAAVQFLVNTDMSVTEIADRTGFSSIEHFSAAFHRLMGCPPRQYRKTHRA